MVYRRRSYRKRTVGMYRRKRVGAKRTTTTYRRRSYRRYGRARPIYERNTAFANPPERIRTILTTAATYNVAPGTASFSTMLAPYSGSDPFFSLSTAQPKGWDALVGQYGKYIVDRGYVNLTFTNETTNAVSVILYRSTGSVPSNYAEARQWAGAKERVVQAAGGSRTYVSFKFAFNSRYNSYGNNDDKDEWVATTETGANATGRVGYIGIYMTSLKSSSAANITGVMSMRMIQSTRFAEPVAIAADTTAD